MVKTIAVFMFALVASVTILTTVSAQSATSTPTPRPTEAMTPAGAPSTGFGTQQ